MGKGKAIKVLDIHESMNIPLIDRRFNHPQVVQNVVDQQHTCFLKPESTAGWKSPLRKKQRYTCYICQWEGHLHVEHEGGISTLVMENSSFQYPLLCDFGSVILHAFQNTKIPTRSSTLQFIKEFHACLSWMAGIQINSRVCNSVKDIFLMSTEMYVHTSMLYVYNIYKKIDTHPWLYIE